MDYLKGFVVSVFMDISIYSSKHPQILAMNDVRYITD